MKRAGEVATFLFFFVAWEVYLGARKVVALVRGL